MTRGHVKKRLEMAKQVELRTNKTCLDAISLPAFKPLEQAVRAKVMHIWIVPPLVEHAADLVCPSLAVVTLHPVFVYLLKETRSVNVYLWSRMRRHSEICLLLLRRSITNQKTI